MDDFNDMVSRLNPTEAASLIKRGLSKPRSIQHREYGQVPSKLWMGQVVPQFLQLSVEGKLLYLYLLSCHHSNMAGIFHLRWEYVAVDVGLDHAKVQEARRELEAASLIKYEDNLYRVWVVDFLETQVTQVPLLAKDNRVQALRRILSQCGEPYTGEFLAHNRQLLPEIEYLSPLA